MAFGTAALTPALLEKGRKDSMLSRRTLLATGSAGMIASAAHAQSPSKTSNSTVVIQLPPPILSRQIATAGAATDSFSVESQGYGSFTGLAYTVPAHTKGKLKAQIQTLALTSNDVENLNNLIKGMVSSSQYEKIRDYEATHASANISFWGFWSGGGGASYDKTHEAMRGFGLSEDNIKTIVSAMAEDAKKMSHVELDFDVDNSPNDYAVSGSLLLYTIARTIKSANEQRQYRMLADRGVAGGNDATAPASGKVIPLP
jgi:hypothetical protein